MAKDLIPRSTASEIGKRVMEQERLIREQLRGIDGPGGVSDIVRRLGEEERRHRMTIEAFGGQERLGELMRRATEHQRLFSKLFPLDRLAEITRQQRLFSEAFPPDRLADIKKQLALGVQYAPAFQDRVSKIAEMAHRSIADFEAFTVSPLQSTIAEIQKSLSFDESRFGFLTEQMLRIPEPWAFRADQIGSVGAFIELEAFSTSARSLPTFGEEHHVLIASELGAFDETFVEAEGAEDEEAAEEAYTAAGRNPALVAFPSRSYPSVLHAAGWTEPHAHLPAPRLEDGSIVDGFSYDPADHALLTHVEAHLRFFVETCMIDKFGPKWMKDHVHPERLQLWEQRREKSVSLGFPRLSLINYADFSELKDVICKKKPWGEVFNAIFGIREVFTTSMIRLHGIRIELSHARLLTNTARLMLEVEANAIFRAIGAIRH